MPDDLFGANEFTVEELEALFQDDEPEQSPPPANNTGTDAKDGDVAEKPDTSKGNDVTTTQSFAKRLRESTEKARQEERESIAKSLGYDSYDAMQKAREKRYMTDKGLDVDEVSPVIDEIVKQRLENDPRMKELETLRNREVIEFGKKELAEITKLTGGEITALSQLPKEVIESWKQKGSLVKAYMEHEGVNLVNKIRSEHSKGSTSHLANPTGTSNGGVTQRHLTNEEKQMWKLFHPSITEEELNKKMVNM